MKFNVFIFIILFCFASSTVLAQNNTENKTKDTTKVFKDLGSFSKKSKFGKFIHKLLFKSTRQKKVSKKITRKKLYIKKAFDKHEGKIIRNIIIETLDPFGFSAENEQEKPNKGFERFGNNLHMKSKNWTIKNYLLFKKNEPLDSVVAKESERLVRRQRFARSVIIKPVAIPDNKDSVDVSVRVLDSWSLIPTGSISGSRANVELTERNFFGLGHELSNDVTKRFSDGANAYSSRYRINNLRNSFINTTFLYANSLENDTRKSARMERLFVSPLTRFAGGVFFENRSFNDSLPNSINEFEKTAFKNETRDYWFGHSFKVFDGKNEDYRATNLVTTLGYKKVNYIKAPTISLDPSRYFSDEELYLASIGLNVRKFAEDKYLFNFGIIEDVPYGQVYSITGGFQNKNQKTRSYFGGRFAYGNYFKIGYFGTNIEWGSFFEGKKSEETVFKIQGTYFTNLFSIGSWKIRQFINPTLVVGSHRVPIIADRVTFDGENEISGFSNPLINGTRKLALIFQTQTYTPGTWRGFRFSPFYNMSFGFLGDRNDTFLNPKVFSKLSIGVLINNDYLVFNSFQISLSFFPNIPFSGTNVFKTNSLNNDELGLPNYEINQPTIVPFR